MGFELRRLTLLAFLLLLALSAVAQTTDPTLKSWGEIKYPPLARQARIQGKVQLEFWVNHDGDVVSVNVVSGHPMLAPAAAENVKTWKFSTAKNAPLDDRRYEMIFDFELSTDESDLATGSKARFVFDSFRHVHVIADLIGRVYKEGCPSEREKLPPIKRSAKDFVEMSRSSCYGTCPAYTVRIHADGAVEWEGRSFVAQKGKDSSNIGPSSARDLIDKFASPEFWALCASYSEAVTDSASAAFRVSIGERIKSVDNYAGSAPHLAEDLEYAIDDAADTHHWLHGDPRDEPLSNVERDAYGPKPGLTPLMRATALGDSGKVQTLLKEGAAPDQTDSSGWNALMYASDRSCGHDSCVQENVMQRLLSAGADPKYTSPRGDTALMAAAYDRRFEGTLAHAGANVNAQNVDGVTVLMILASQAEGEEIQKALQAGADPRLKDAQGRSALDYLKLANCGQNPLRNPIRDSNVEYGQCNALNAGDVAESEELLRSAMHEIAQ